MARPGTHWGLTSDSRDHRLHPTMHELVPTLCKLAGLPKPVGEIEDRCD
jgi:hypothetical protein